MCAGCGCNSGARASAVVDNGGGHIIAVEADLLAENNDQAAINRSWFEQQGVLTLNLLSSPGSGKTTLLTRTLAVLKSTYRLAVIEGDQQTSHDAERIRATGVPALQINTGKGCHLDARMIAGAIDELRPPADSILFIENVGNLVCPAAFDLGEAFKVVILSVTEGEDKPLKYPDMFHAADLVLLNKTDLLPYVSFDVDRCRDYIQRIKPGIDMIPLSASDGTGMDDWYDWVGAACHERQGTG